MFAFLNILNQNQLSVRQMKKKALTFKALNNLAQQQAIHNADHHISNLKT